MIARNAYSLRALAGASLLCLPLLAAALHNPRLGAGLALAALGALSLWWMKKAGLLRGGSVRETSPLQLKSKLQLSPKWSVALIEVEGQSYLLTLGESAAVVRRTPVQRRPVASFPELVSAPAREVMS